MEPDVHEGSAAADRRRQPNHPAGGYRPSHRPAELAVSPPHAAPAPPRRLALAVATAFGAFGVASLPATLAYPSVLAPYILSLAAPVSVAIVGEALGLRWLRAAGIVTVLIGAAAPVIGLGLLLAALTVLGPLAVVLVLGPALRQVDPFAGTAFLSASAIAVAGGFAGAALSPPMVVGVTVLVLAGGTTATISRLDEDHVTRAELDEAPDG